MPLNKIQDAVMRLPFLVPSFLSKKVFYPMWDVYEGKERVTEWKRLEQSQWEPFSEAEHFARFQEIAAYAKKYSPYYRDQRIDAPERLEDLHRWPLLTKEDLRKNLSLLVSEEYGESQLVTAKTGGSTGVSLRVYFDPISEAKRNAATIRSDQWSGWRLGEPKGAVWGNPPVYSGWKGAVRYHLLDRTVYLDTLELNESTMNAFISKIKRLGLRTLFGHSHSLFIFANYVKSKRLRLPMRGIISTSMMLIPSERKVIEDVFETKVTNRYGCEEVGLIASECEEHRGFHLNADHLYIEFLRADGQPAQPGEDGFIVITDLMNKGMPLLRYVIGDRGVKSARKCPCGRTLPMMEKITGRMADFLIKTDGSLVAGVSIIERTLTAVPGIAQMQLIQPALNEIEILIVPDENFSTDTRHKLLDSFEAIFGPETQFKVTVDDKLQQEKNGKYRFSICRVKTPYHTARELAPL